MPNIGVRFSMEEKKFLLKRLREIRKIPRGNDPLPNRIQQVIKEIIDANITDGFKQKPSGPFGSDFKLMEGLHFLIFRSKGGWHDNWEAEL